jgi:hypothetical protein
MNIRCRKNHEIPAIIRGLAVPIGALFTIAVSQVAGGQRSTDATDDTHLLSAMLKAAKADVGRGELRVDPRPLVWNHELYTVEPEAIASVSPRVVRRRTAVIHAAGLRTADAKRLNQNNCPGVFVMRQDDSVNHTDPHAGCPEGPFYVLAIGPPRAGTAVLTGDQVYDGGARTAARGYWAARVIRTALGSGGSSVYASDYVLTKRSGAWVVIKIVGLTYTE